jgi:Fe(3+) dicitrate transport protein
MGRAVLSYLILMLLSFQFSIIFSQEIKAYIVDIDKKPIQFAKIVSGNEKVLSNEKGEFILKNVEDSIVIFHHAFEKQVLDKNELKNNSHITLKSIVFELDEAKVYQKKLNQFDIGFLPPVKGVMIATGTNTLIQTENQSGAKSSGNPRELFAKVPGLNIWESDGAGIQMGVGGRGLSPNRAANFNMRQNGYDISADALGYPESYYTPPIEALSSIEIIRGSAALQFGTQFGGLMNFVIKEPVKDTPFEFTSRNTVGSFSYLGTFNRISGSKNKWEYQFYHQYKKGDGFRENSQFAQHQFFGQISYELTQRQKIRLEYTGMHYDAQQAGGLTDFQYKLDHQQSVRERNWFRVNWNILAFHYDFQINSSSTFNFRTFGMNSSRYSLGFLGKINQMDPGGNRELIAGDFINGGGEARFLKRYKFGIKDVNIKSAFLTGLRYYQGYTSSKQGLSSANSNPDFQFLNPNNLETSSFEFPSQNLAAFIENIWFVGDKFTFNAGMRLEYIKSASMGFYKQYSIHPLNFDTISSSIIEDENSLSRIVPLFGAGGSYKTTKNTSLYANFSMNYRAINFNDIRVNNPNVIIDSLIKDEFGSTTEIGFRGLIHKHFYVDLSYFYLFYGDKIGLAPETNGIKKIRTNIGDAINSGFETFMEVDYIKLFKDDAKISSTFFVNFSYISSSYVKSKERNFIGNQVEYVSPIILKSGLKLKANKLTAQIQYSYNSEQFSDASNAIEASGDAIIGLIPAYSVVDFSLRYEFKKWFQLETGINNLLNEKYFTRRATAYPGPGILPSDGRNFYFTLQYKFKK